MTFLRNLILLVGLTAAVLVSYFLGHMLAILVSDHPEGWMTWLGVAGGMLAAAAALLFLYMRMEPRERSEAH